MLTDEELDLVAKCLVAAWANGERGDDALALVRQVAAKLGCAAEVEDCVREINRWLVELN